MKKTYLAMSLLILLALMSLTGCTKKYCAVSGCPSETNLIGSDYCTLHKCANSSCRNRGSLPNSLSYCEECIRRAD